MYLKLYPVMHKKDRGYVLLESIVIFMIVAFIAMLLNKIVVNNYLKATVVHTNEDIRTLSNEEEEIILESMEFFSKEDDKNKFTKNKSSGEIRKAIITISDNNGLMTIEKSGNRKRYIELECSVSNVGNIRSVELKPRWYKTDYIYGNN